MAGTGLEFNIIANDQATKVVAAVQKKLGDFGKDVGKSIVAIAGPMAIATMAISKVSDYLDDMKQKAKEAFDWGASLSDSAAKMGVTVEQFQQISAAAEKTGISVDKVGQAFKLASDLIASAKAGSKDAAAALEAMGINIADIDNVKPQDVLSRLSAALAATADPAQRAQIAMAALGKSAKDLQDVLAKGFDIAGALQNTEGLTTEEADFLRQQAREEAKVKNKERLKEARQQAAERFLETDPEADAIKARARDEAIRQGAQGAAIGIASSTAVLSKNEAVQKEIQRILAEREAARAKASAEANPPNAAAAAGLLGKAAADAAKDIEEKKPKEPKGSKIGGASNEALGSVSVKAPALTVSSLREIGGGFAGESIGTTTDLLQIQVDIQKSMLKELENINSRSRDFQDPTKTPVPGGVFPGQRVIA